MLMVNKTPRRVAEAQTRHDLNGVILSLPVHFFLVSDSEGGAGGKLHGIFPHVAVTNWFGAPHVLSLHRRHVC